MYFSMADHNPSWIYHFMTQSIVPRPIAWVLSDSGDGCLNLAPFSYFNGICSDPPIIYLSAGRKPDGELKDTRVNLEQRKDFVLHIPHCEQAALVTESAAHLPHGESEIEAMGMELTDFEGAPLPRLKDCRVAMYCRFDQLIEVGRQKQALILAEVHSVYIDDEIATQDGEGRLQIDPVKLDPLARLGGAAYCGIGDLISLKRPG